jgi:hypothetical protein
MWGFIFLGILAALLKLRERSIRTLFNNHLSNSDTTTIQLLRFENNYFPVQAFITHAPPKRLSDTRLFSPIILP